MPDEHAILPELVARRPVGPAVREGDDEWFSVVRWTLYALIAAEELGITSASVDFAKDSSNAAVRRFLGIDMDLGKRLGLRPDWTQRIVRQVGNYGELFERHLGPEVAPEARSAPQQPFGQRRSALRTLFPLSVPVSPAIGRAVGDRGRGRRGQGMTTSTSVLSPAFTVKSRR